jgi:hypothetical protein
MKMQAVIVTLMLAVLAQLLCDQMLMTASSGIAHGNDAVTQTHSSGDPARVVLSADGRLLFGVLMLVAMEAANSRANSAAALRMQSHDKVEY